MKRKIRNIIKFSVIVIVLILVAGLIFPTWTPAIKGERSISTLEQVPINGTKLEVMIRGADRDNPIMILVHGGPGSSEIPYVRKYQDQLEQNFTIVHYDQRGSGKSYHFLEDYSNLSRDLLVEDLLELTDYIEQKLGQKKVLLAGHSFGTYIGMMAAAAAPEKFAAYIGIGQVSDTSHSELDSLEYTLDQAKQAGNVSDVKRLELLRVSIASGDQMTPRDMVRKYGGAARQINPNQDYLTGFLFEPEYNLLDMIRYFTGIAGSQDTLLAEERRENITRLVGRMEIPTYFVMGKYDFMTSAKAARDYFDELEAPRKEFVLFEHSAHYPQFEEKELFAEWLTNISRELVFD